MIKNYELAKAVFIEAKALCQRHVYKENPDIGAEDKFQRMLSAAPLPTVEEMADVIERVFWSSFLSEEGRPCRSRLLYLPMVDAESKVHRLENPVPLIPECLRKIMPAQGSLSYLTWEMMKGEPFITGIQARQAVDPPNLIISVPSAGAIDIAWHFFRILTFRAGEIRQLSKCALPDASKLYALVSQALGSFEPNFLGSIVRNIVKQDHGGALWIMHEGHTPKDMHINYKFKPDAHSLLERFEKHESREYWLNSIANLAAVDGAVLLDSRIRVIGYGAFVKTGKPIEVDRQLPEGQQESILSTSLGGGRHRSAVEFCRIHSPAAAIVVSVDGRVTFIASLDEKAKPLCAEIATLGFSDKLF